MENKTLYARNQPPTTTIYLSKERLRGRKCLQSHRALVVDADTEINGGFRLDSRHDVVASMPHTCPLIHICYDIACGKVSTEFLVVSIAHRTRPAAVSQSLIQTWTALLASWASNSRTCTLPRMSTRLPLRPGRYRCSIQSIFTGVSSFSHGSGS